MNNNSGFIFLALVLAGLCVGAFFVQKKRDAQIAQRQHMSECVQVDAAGAAPDDDEYTIHPEQRSGRVRIIGGLGGSTTGVGGSAPFVTGENGAVPIMRGRQ